MLPKKTASYVHSALEQSHYGDLYHVDGVCKQRMKDDRQGRESYNPLLRHVHQ